VERHFFVLTERTEMKRIYRTPGTSGGFSLIEVMIAVVVLATGLLALAALQASLTRSSAEAKVRGRVAAMLSARMDELRGSGYENTILDPVTPVATTSTTDGCDGDATDWIDCARGQANLSSLTVTQANTLWTSAVGAATFTEVDSRTKVGDGNPEFIRVTLRASWSDATGGTHGLTTASEFSSLALKDSVLPPPAGAGTPTGRPIVRTDNPAGPGVIPIAVGGGDATAASNPRPELVGKSNNTTVTGTRFDVLTYTGLTGAAVIQRRVETAVIKCQCQLGAGGTNLPVIYRKSEWPAIWTGERYDVYVPDPIDTPAPGQGKSSGPKPGVDQSPLCQECCRDHFDGTETTVAKFDPKRGTHPHYLVDGSGALAAMAATDTNYVDSCRVIRVDGFWHTAADMYSDQFGLLATETVSGKEAATGLPDDTDPIKTATNYQTFVKDYLKQFDGSGNPPAIAAQTMFDQSTRQLNEPDDVDIATPDSKDYRYLHGRGLYLDFLEEKARTKIANVDQDFTKNGYCLSISGQKVTDLAECILPYLPFTTVNVTELAKWKATDTEILSVNSGNLLGSNPTQPSGSRTAGVAKGVADNGGRINMSNFGLAASSDPVFATINGVDPSDATAIGSDAQRFDVGGDSSPPSSGEEFSVRVSGVTTQDPDVFYTVDAGADAGECLRPNATADYRCATNTTPIAGGSITVSNYWIEGPATTRTHTFSCEKPNGTMVSVTFSASTPTFHDYEVLSATIQSSGVTVSPPYSVSNENKKTEATTISLPTLAANDVVLVSVGEESGSPTYATVASCSTNGSADPDKTTVDSWNMPWTTP